MREVTSRMPAEGGIGPGTDARSGLSASCHPWLLNLMVNAAPRWLETKTRIECQDDLKRSQSG